MSHTDKIKSSVKSFMEKSKEQCVCLLQLALISHDKVLILCDKCRNNMKSTKLEAKSYNEMLTDWIIFKI